jgi:hypothetical protein
MNALLVAVLGGLIGALAPVLLIRANGRERRKDQEQTWARDDKVAEQAAEAAELLLAAQKESIARTDAVAERVAAATSTTTAQLNAIHTLVNSDMTAARQSELDQTRVTLAVLRKVVALDLAAGRDPAEADRATIDATEARIAELEAILEDRLAQQQAVEAGTRAAKTTLDGGG